MAQEETSEGEAKRIIEEGKAKRVNAFLADFNSICEKHKCGLHPHITIFQGRLEAKLVAVPSE